MLSLSLAVAEFQLGGLPSTSNLVEVFAELFHLFLVEAAEVYPYLNADRRCVGRPVHSIHEPHSNYLSKKELYLVGQLG